MACLLYTRIWSVHLFRWLALWNQSYADCTIVINTVLLRPPIRVNWPIELIELADTLCSLTWSWKLQAANQGRIMGIQLTPQEWSWILKQSVISGGTYAVDRLLIFGCVLFLGMCLFMGKYQIILFPNIKSIWLSFGSLIDFMGPGKTVTQTKECWAHLPMILSNDSAIKYLESTDVSCSM